MKFTPLAVYSKIEPARIPQNAGAYCWGPTGQWGIPDIALVGIGLVSLILGILRRR